MQEVRIFTWKDIAAVLSVEQECFPKESWDELTFLEWYESYPDGFLVAETATDKIVGYIICSADGYIASIAVAKKERRKGIGSTLLAQAAKRLNLKEMGIHCRINNNIAQDFFKKLNFKEVRRIKHFYSDREDAIEMKR